jgi:hypothetical protein
MPITRTPGRSTAAKGGSRRMSHHKGGKPMAKHAKRKHKSMQGELHMKAKSVPKRFGKRK